MSQAAGQPRGLSVTDSVELGRGRLSSTDLTLARHVSSNAPPSQFFPCAVNAAQSQICTKLTLLGDDTKSPGYKGEPKDDGMLETFWQICAARRTQ